MLKFLRGIYDGDGRLYDPVTQNLIYEGTFLRGTAREMEQDTILRRKHWSMRVDFVKMSMMGTERNTIKMAQRRMRDVSS